MKNKMGGMDTADLDATAVLGTPDTVRQRIRALEADLGPDAIPGTSTTVRSRTS